jgi:hypothetical protein
MGYGQLVASDFELLASSLRSDTADAEAFVEALAAKLAGAFPGHVRVERGGLLGNGRAERIEVELGERRYTIASKRGALRASRSRTVRGIVLKNEELPVHEWIDSLSRDLAETAGESELGRQALERLLHE